MRAAAAMLASLKVTGHVVCLLAPPHAATVRVALDKIGPRTPIIVLVPDSRKLQVLLTCDDFSAEIREHRLWFASGPQWAEELERLLEDRPGLPTPSQFIRMPSADPAVVDPMIASAQAVFGSCNGSREEIVRARLVAWRLSTTPRDSLEPRLCIVTGRHFRLWDDAGAVLRRNACAVRCARCE